MNCLKIILICGALVTLAACSSAPTPATPAAAASAASGTTPNSAPTEESGPVTLKITSPSSGEVVKTTDVPLTFVLTHYHIEPNGQHIHVILDNEPYQPCYTTAEPFILKDVKPGAHTVRAFPSRAWHESIKEPTAFATVSFYVEKKEGTPPVSLKKPLLTYSRPKGKYEGEKANKILFDFFLTNVDLGENGYKVKYSLDDQKPQIISDWKPSYFENLPDGKHKLVVELVDAKGRPVKGNKFNRTEREFEVTK